MERMTLRDAERSRLAKNAPFINHSTVEASAVVPPTISATVAPSPGVRPPTAVVPVTPPAAATATMAAWSNSDWLLASMYERRLREAAYRCDAGALWAAAVNQHHHHYQQQQQQQTGNFIGLLRSKQPVVLYLSLHRSQTKLKW